jgi:hypothetical protein
MKRHFIFFGYLQNRIQKKESNKNFTRQNTKRV